MSVLIVPEIQRAHEKSVRAHTDIEFQIRTDLIIELKLGKECSVGWKETLLNYNRTL